MIYEYLNIDDRVIDRKYMEGRSASNPTVLWQTTCILTSKYNYSTTGKFINKR